MFNMFFLYQCLPQKHKVEYGVILVTGILHTIVFHRALGLVRPKDVDLELFDVTYVSHSEIYSLSLIGSSLCNGVL